jgi:hypothetical protein
MKMKFMVCSMLLFSAIFAADQTFSSTLDSMPSNISEFEALRDKLATTPEGGVLVLIAALKMYNENPGEGIKAMIVAVDQGLLSKSDGKDNYKGYALGSATVSLVKSQLGNYPYVINSYLPGATPGNNYVPGPLPYKFELTANQYSGDAAKGQIKLFIKSSGADSPRPVTLKKNSKGIWKAYEFSSIVVGIRKPVKMAQKEDNL